MDNNEILDYAAQRNYTWLYLDQSTRMGYGPDNWAAQLAQLTTSQRLTLEAKITRQERRLQREDIANRTNFALQRLAKNSQRSA